MIKKLTPEQERLMYQVRDEWITRLNNLPPLDKERATKGVRWLYRLASLAEPEVVFVDGPSSVGASVGDSVRASVRALVGDSVRASVGDSVIASVRASVGASVGESVGASVGDSVRASVRALVGDSVRASVGDSVIASVGDSVGESVGASVGDSVRDSVRASVRASVGAFCPIYGDISDFAWVACYDFFARIGVKLCDEFEPFRELVGDCGIFSMLQGSKQCVIWGMPEFIKREPDGVRMHCATGPCIRWKDGFELYQLYGVMFSKEGHSRAVAATPQEALGWPNIEQRRAILRTLGIEKVFDSLDTKLIDEQQGYRLYAVDGYARETAYALRYNCPSTGREYVSFVRPEVGEKKDALAAIASKWGLSREMWGRIAAHS